jgi:N6-adenosine-specific RNA methylase IME4
MKKFQVIVADPPWVFFDKIDMITTPRGAAANYKTMSISDIKNLSISEITDPNGTVLALWVPSSLLQEGLDTMSSWGFKHKQTYVWVKTKKDPFVKLVSSFGKNVLQYCKDNGWNAFLKHKTPGNIRKILSDTAKSFTLNDSLAFGMGRLFRQTHEICLIGTSNNKIYKKINNKSQRSVSFAENLKHSAKPEFLQNSLDLMFPNENRLEIFARRQRPGWICLGNEVCDGEDIRDSIKRIQLL